LGSNRELCRRVKEAILPVIAERNYQLVDIEFVREGRGQVLRIFLDKQGGINVEDCADVSRELGDILDVKNIIETSYHLEISSPGLDRRVRDPADFERFSGRRIKIKTEQPINGRRHFSGMLRGVKGDNVTMECDGAEIEIPIEIIEKANLTHEWNDNFC